MVTEEAVYESYMAANEAGKKEVARVKVADGKMLGKRLDLEEGQRVEFRIAHQIVKERCDMTGVSCLKDEVGQIVVYPDGVEGIWQR